MQYPLNNDDGLFVEDKLTPLTEAEGTYYLREAWKYLFGEYPSVNSLSLLWAQTVLETGRFKYLHLWNYGNIKRIKGEPWTSYKCSEVLNGKNQWFFPYHPQTHFRAYKDALDGTIEYVKFLSQRKRYTEAWQWVIKGDPVEYCKALKKAGYFTADLGHYTKGVVSLTNEFKRKSSELLSWSPPVQENPEPAVEDPPTETPSETKPEELLDDDDVPTIRISLIIPAEPTFKPVEHNSSLTVPKFNLILDLLKPVINWILRFFKNA